MYNIQSVLNTLKLQNGYRNRKIITGPQSTKILIGNRTILNFSSNDYLGLANHPKLKLAVIDGVKKYGVGSGASHLISGHTEAHEVLEQQFAKFFNTERSLLFSSGYLANIGVIGALSEQSDCLIQDKLNHASLLDGGKLSKIKMYRFVHKNMDQLEKLLQKKSNCLVASDAVFSMDGDIADIESLTNLTKQYQANLFIDEAHSFGILGENGRGICHKISAENRPIIMATCGKSLGTFGAVVAGDNDLIEFLIQKARSYMYTTALPASIAHASIIALKLLKNADDKRQHLNKLIKYLQENILALGFRLLPSDTPIQALIVKNNPQALKLSEFLLKHNILIQAIRPPTVPRNTARLRITLSATHSFDDINYLLDTLKKYQKQYG